MENVTKKEFFAKYASKESKDNIKSAAIFSYICAAISVALGLYTHNYSMMFDVVLVIGFGLGIQFARSRVCAVLMLVYSILNVIYMVMSIGRIAGWWLIILIGIYAVKGTFNLNKEYKRFLKDGTIPENTKR